MNRWVEAMNGTCTAVEHLPVLSYFDSLSIAGETVAAATALAGLVIVYLGNLHSAFTHLPEEKQGRVKAQFQKRARIAFEGVEISLVAAALGVFGKLRCSELVADLSTVFLAVAFFWAFRVARMTRREVTSADS
jgi:hypothetical protein